MLEIKEAKFAKLIGNKSLAMVFLGCGGDLREWTDGIREHLVVEGIIPDVPEEEIFSDFFKLTTSGGRTDLVMVFKEGAEAKVHTGKLVGWRLCFGDCSWLEDYVVNYASHH